MFRHIFIAEFKDDVDENTRDFVIEEMKKMKNNISSIYSLSVNKTLGWLGKKDLILMTVEVKSKEDFEFFQAHPYHKDYISSLGSKYCKIESFIVSQIEI